MKEYIAFSTGQGKLFTLLLSLYFSVREKEAFEVRVYVSSLIALFMSIIHMAESMRNIVRTRMKIRIPPFVRDPFRLAIHQTAKPQL